MSLSNEHKPMITVYMPTHNRVELLQRAVASVFAQTIQDFELIIVDDASSDNTLDYLTKLALQKSNVTVLRNEVSQGACVSRNRAIDIAKGKFITGLDDDDEFLPHRLEALLASYDSKYAFVNHGYIWHYGKQSKKVGNIAKVITLDDQLSSNYGTNQVFVETERLRAIGGFDKSFKACQDYDTWTRLIITFGNAKSLGDASYVVHQGHEGPRITAKGNHAKGYRQYYEKHQHLMSESNKINQRWLTMRALRVKPTIKEFFLQVRHGFWLVKTRYYLSVLLVPLAEIRRKWLRG
jgi:glycosyltransferase involved in cell wall biosynthesis